MHLKTSSAKRWTFCKGRDVLKLSDCVRAGGQMERSEWRSECNNFRGEFYLIYMYSRSILRAFETFWLLSNYNPSSIALTNSVRTTRMHLKGTGIYLECTTIATASVIQAAIQLQSQCIRRRYKIFWLYLNRILSVCIIFQLHSIFIVDQLYLKCTKIETYLKHIHIIPTK